MAQGEVPKASFTIRSMWISSIRCISFRGSDTDLLLDKLPVKAPSLADPFEYV